MSKMMQLKPGKLYFFFFSNGMLRSVPFNYDLLQVKIGDVVMCFLVFQLFWSAKCSRPTKPIHFRIPAKYQTKSSKPSPYLLLASKVLQLSIQDDLLAVLSIHCRKCGAKFVPCHATSLPNRSLLVGTFARYPLLLLLEFPRIEGAALASTAFVRVPGQQRRETPLQARPHQQSPHGRCHCQHPALMPRCHHQPWPWQLRPNPAQRSLALGEKEGTIAITNMFHSFW